MIAQSRDFRRFVHPRRDHVLARPRRSDAAHDFVTVKARWATARNHWIHGWTRRTDESVAIEREADAVLCGDALPEATAPTTLAAAERMLNGASTLVGYVAARFGLGDALRMKVRADAWSITTGREKATWWWRLAKTNPGSSAIDEGWRALRRAACGADDASYAAARDEARTIRAAQPDAPFRVRIDFAFPGEPDWARDDATTILANAANARLLPVAMPLLASLVDEPTILRLLSSFSEYESVLATSYACDFVVALDVDAATRVLAKLADDVLRARQRDQQLLRPLAAALGAIRTEPMARELARWLRHPRFGRHVVAYFEQEDELAGVLAKTAREKSIAGDAARELLAGNARTKQPDEGSMADAPAILRNPPWRRTPSSPPLELVTLPWHATIGWAPGERERIANAPPLALSTALIRPIAPDELAEYDALPQNQKYVDCWPRWENRRWLVLELPRERCFEAWNSGESRLYTRPPCWALACFGERALPGLFARNAFDEFDDRMLDAHLRVDSPPSALVAARLFVRRRSLRKRARAWLLAHGEATAVGLVPVAIGRPGRSHRIVVRALRLLAHEQPDVVADVAARYGDAARDAVRATFFAAPLERLGVRGRPPKWLRLDSLPRLRAKSGRPLPRAAGALLVDVLRCRGDDVPYAGIDALREELDPTALGDFVWSLFTLWLLQGCPRAHGWMATALGAFPSDDTALRLRPYVRELAQSNPRACGVLVDLLATLADDSARIVLAELEPLARSPALHDVLAEARGVDGDDATFDVGLDALGGATLDLGSRTVRIVLDESLAPRVILADGRSLSQMPRASSADDPARVADATARFKRLRRVSQTVAKQEILRLERSMVLSRRAPAAELQARWSRDALFAQLAHRIVWGVFAGPVVTTTFRVAEDATLGDDHDLPFTLDPDASVGVVHPIDLEEATRARWASLFADYEILQPFEQLGRIAFAGTSAEALATLNAAAGAVVDGRSLLRTIDGHRWQRTGRRIVSAHKTLRGTKPGLGATLMFAPGIDLSAIEDSREQKISKLVVAGTTTLDEVERIELSELVRTALTVRS